eukprot:TRINITY_DN11042_c1_g2_i1.p1 TRINITY_DN11042_c1_g2~~TRINITY_DN11042_c1_g2_i1.p1  ORF type:complete len:1193 (+),score=290.11 TRINITY_DN11042_c1_g2_i1:47-3580(+)
MELADFAVSVVAAKVLKDGKDYKSVALLADMLTAAAGEISTDEWMYIWCEGVTPFYFKRTTEEYVREKLMQAAVEFVRNDDSGAKALMEVTNVPDKLTLTLRIHLLSSSPESFPCGLGEQLLQSLLELEDEEWIGVQLAKLFKIVTLAPDQRQQMWSALETKGGASPGAAVSALRLTEIFGTADISDTFIENTLSHRTRATRRMGLQLMKTTYEAQEWWGPWSAAFTVISDEQPWHIIHPAWQDVLAVIQKVPENWCTVLALRGASHSDNRVVRRVCCDVFTADLPLSISQAVTTPALDAGCEIPVTSPALLRHLTAIVSEDPSLGRETAETFFALTPKDYPQDTHEEIASQLATISKAWRGSGHPPSCLIPLAAACLRFGVAQHACAPSALLCLEALPLSALPDTVAKANLTDTEKAAFVKKAIADGIKEYSLLGAVSMDTLKGAVGEVDDKAQKFAICVVGCVGVPSSSSEESVTLCGEDFSFSWVEECLQSLDEVVLEAVCSVLCASSNKHLADVAARVAAKMLSDDKPAAAHLAIAVPPSSWSSLPAPRQLVEQWIQSGTIGSKDTTSKITMFCKLGGLSDTSDWLERVVKFYGGLKATKKAKTPRGIKELMEAVLVTGKYLSEAWQVLLKYQPKFSGSREAYKAYFTAAVKDHAHLRGLPKLDERVMQSSIVASQLTAVVLGEMDDAELLAKLAVHSPAPKSQALDGNHPGVVISKARERKVDASKFAAAVLEEVRKDVEPEGNDGSAAQLRRVREWWVLCALLPQVVPATANLIAAAAVNELKAARVVPRTRVLVQNAWAAACALHPTESNCLPLLNSILETHTTETRLAVSSLVVAAHLLLTDSGVEKKTLTVNVLGWTMAMPHTAKVHAQLVLAELLEKTDFDSEFMKSVKGFLAENPHLKALRGHAGIDKAVSLYITETPPFMQTSVEMKTLKALRLVQNRFSELEGNENEVAAPSAGWASKGSRKCPARARGKTEVDDESDEGTDGEEEIVDATHQRRPTPGRPMATKEPQICVVGSFLDNLPNQAGLCRTLEALFGSVAECTLASLKAAQEPAFLRMSMASERWLKLVEIPPGERLATYIQRKRREGFTIVALEQTDTSVPAPLYTFKQKTVIIIGNEQLGCPSWLLRRPELVHDFVELPLDGASRSLNAHVTAAAMLWQYRMQTY